MAAFVNDELDKGIAQVQTRAVLVAERETAPAEKTVDVVFNVESAQVYWATRHVLCSFLTGKGSTRSAFVKVGPQFDHRQGGRRADDFSHGAEIAAPGLATEKSGHDRGPKKDAHEKQGGAKWPLLHLSHRFGPNDQGKKNQGKGSAVLGQEKGRFAVEAQPQCLQDTTDTGERTDAAPEFAHEKPAHHDADPPDSPGQEERDVAGWIIGTKQPQQNNKGKGDVAKTAKIEKVMAMLIESFDPRIKCKQIDTSIFVVNKQNLDDLFDTF